MFEFATMQALLAPYPFEPEVLWLILEGEEIKKNDYKRHV